MSWPAVRPDQSLQHRPGSHRPPGARFTAPADPGHHGVGANGTVTLPDIRFETASYWVNSGALGFKANLALKLLENFNLRFNIGQNGLSDRIAPLLGFEWAF